ncbi:MAG TPA: FAD-dependent oxidoreductase, partial [Prosthecobacter sp.]
MKQESPWELPRPPSFPSLHADAQTEVLIVGGGITGVTAAYLLSKAGHAVTLVEKARLCGGETKFTTAHISYPTDMRMRDLVKKFGDNHAGAVWDACQSAAEQIRRNICHEEIDCGYGHVPGYLYAANDASTEVDHLQEDAELAHQMGFDAEFLPSCPVTNRPAVRFANLMKFHPMRYVLRLAEAAQKAGCHIHEESEVKEFDSENHAVRCNGHRITYQHVFIATH